MKDRLTREKQTLRAMVKLYCRDHHPGEGLCGQCQEFLAYAEQRLGACPYGGKKPTCARCPIHCYKPIMREQAREIMRYTGPRMLFWHPWLAILHLLDRFRKVRPPKAKGETHRNPS